MGRPRRREDRESRTAVGQDRRAVQAGRLGVNPSKLGRQADTKGVKVGQTVGASR